MAPAIPSGPNADWLQKNVPSGSTHGRIDMHRLDSQSLTQIVCASKQAGAPWHTKEGTTCRGLLLQNQDSVSRETQSNC